VTLPSHAVRGCTWQSKEGETHQRRPNGRLQKNNVDAGNIAHPSIFRPVSDAAPISAQFAIAKSNHWVARAPLFRRLPVFAADKHFVIGLQTDK